MKNIGSSSVGIPISEGYFEDQFVMEAQLASAYLEVGHLQRPMPLAGTTGADSILTYFA